MMQWTGCWNTKSNTDILSNIQSKVDHSKCNLRRLRSASSASNFSIFSGKWRLAHHTSPMNASTTNTVIKPNQNGSCSIRSDNGLYGMCIMRRSHFAPSHQAWQRQWNLPFFSKHSPRLSHGLSAHGFCFWSHSCPIYPWKQWHYKYRPNNSFFMFYYFVRFEYYAKKKWLDTNFEWRWCEFTFSENAWLQYAHC